MIRAMNTGFMSNTGGRIIIPHRQVSATYTQNVATYPFGSYPLTNTKVADGNYAYTTFCSAGVSYMWFLIDLGAAKFVKAFQFVNAGLQSSTGVAGKACQYSFALNNAADTAQVFVQTLQTTGTSANIVNSINNVNTVGRYIRVYIQSITDVGFSLYDGYFYMDAIEIWGEV